MESDKSLVQHTLKVQNQYKSEKILQGLNPQQKKAVQSTQGEVVVMAGAGSGKTRVLTRRVAYLIAHDHIKAWHILAVTFTNKASREMDKRIGQLLGTNNTSVTVSTFHSLGMRILRRYTKYVPNYNRNFGIILPSSQKTLVKHILKQHLNLDLKQLKLKPKMILGSISQVKNKGILPKRYKHLVFSDPHSKYDPYKRIVAKAYIRYEQDLHHSNQMDFDDLLLLPVLMFKWYPKALAKCQEKYQYVSVDEYQDVNQLQNQFLNLLTKKYHNLFVVGDVNQSIYSWRGSKPQFILKFRKTHPKAKQIFMTQNYRSTKNILRVANAVIQHNKFKTKVPAFTTNQAGHPVGYIKARNDAHEALDVIYKIRELHQYKHVPYNHMAVLYRTNAQSRSFETYMPEYGIPYDIVGGLKFFDRKEIKDMMSYLQLSVNKKDTASLERIINVPKRQIGNTSVNKLEKFAHANKLNILDATLKIDQCTSLGNTPKQHIKKFGKMMQKVRKQVHKLSVEDAIKLLLKSSGYWDTLENNIKHQKDELTAKNRERNLNELVNMGAEYDVMYHKMPRSIRLVNFLAYVALMTDQDSVKNNQPKVLLMTLHASKGMEFPIVFLIGMEENILPMRYKDEKPNYEEERRLCYVGMTRAEKRLYLSYCDQRMIMGSVEHNPISRFLTEIPKEYIKKGYVQPTNIVQCKPMIPSYKNNVMRWHM